MVKFNTTYLFKGATYSTIAFFISIFLFGCDNLVLNKPEGIVEYDVTYLSNSSEIPTHVLPKKVILRFQGNKANTSIEGFMGLFSLTNISDLKSRSNILLLKVMDNRYYYSSKANDASFIFEGLENMEVVFDTEEKVIAGYNCKKAIVSLPDTTIAPFEVYYNDEIGVRSPNRTNPYYQVDGVLMQFNINVKGIEMQLVASSFKDEKQDDEYFKIPKGYKSVSRNKIDKLITGLME
jgi:GLPGLI family protein